MSSKLSVPDARDQYMYVAMVLISILQNSKKYTQNDELWSVLLLEAGLGAGVGD